MKKSLKILIAVIAVIAVLGGAVAVYCADYYQADQVTLHTAMQTDGVSVKLLNNCVAVEPVGGYDTALVFYPGGKVEHTAYTSFAANLALECGIAVFIPKMPLKLAVLDYNACDNIFSQNPTEFTKELDSQSFYIFSQNPNALKFVGGHSLGGAMASKYYVEHAEELDGLMLFAAYPMGECPSSISIYGDRDQVLDIDKAQTAPNIVVIEGGNHAYFGDYGEQEGDGEAVISRAEQQSHAVNAVNEYIDKIKAERN